MVLELTGLLDSAVGRSVEGKDAAVAFSGGLDSGVLAHLVGKHAGSVSLYTAGTVGSPDVVASEEAAAAMDMDWHFIELDEDTVSDVLCESVRVTGTVDPVVLSFEIPLACVLRVCRERTVVTGQGADEVFAGYSKYLGLDYGEFRAQQAADLGKLSSVTLVHEAAMAASHSKSVAYPFLDRDVMAYGAGLGPEILPQGELRKHALRETALELGLPYIAGRPKKAAQYGSGVMQMCRRISKKSGCSFNELIIGLRNQH